MHPLSAITTPTPSAPLTGLSVSSTRQALDPRGFERVLAGAQEGLSREEEARAAAVDLVSIALVQPTLKMLRDSNQAAPPFAPGPVEKTFGAFFDAEVASRVANASNSGLVDAIALRMLQHPSPHGKGLRD